MPELRVDIDNLRLNAEWQDQAKQYHDWAIEVANCQKKLDEEKSTLEVMEAEIDKSIRMDPSSFGLVKVTENAVASTILLQGDHRLQSKKLIEAKHNLDIARAATAALDHRKRALTMLVELWTRDYYADPNLGTSREVTEQANKEAARSRTNRRKEEDGLNDS